MSTSYIETIPQVLHRVRMESLRDIRRRFKEDAINKKDSAIQQRKMPQRSPPISESGFYSTNSEVNEEDSISQFFFFAVASLVIGVLHSCVFYIDDVIRN